MNKHWKDIERKVGKKIGKKRTALSGGNSGITRADIVDEDLFIEVKYRKKLWIWSLFRETKKLAKKEGKIPVVVVKEKGKMGELWCINSTDLIEVCNKILQKNGGKNEREINIRK